MPYLAAVALNAEVAAMENGLETVIGTGGTRLSGGQAKRLALARTLAHPRPVLVLDDPFSALDRKTEDTVFANLQEYAKDKVVFDRTGCIIFRKCKKSSLWRTAKRLSARMTSC